MKIDVFTILNKEGNKAADNIAGIAVKDKAVLTQVIDVYNERGLNFITEVKEKITWDKERTTEEMLAELEAITPGFLEWAA